LRTEGQVIVNGEAKGQGPQGSRWTILRQDLADALSELAGRCSSYCWTVRLIIALALLSCWAIVMITQASAHDSPISAGSYRNPAGEWCCGASDCGVVTNPASPTGPASPIRGGFSIRGTVTYDDGKAEPVTEFWPASQVLPSPDGRIWRCRRPDGSPRCTFLSPGST
jgi:hypothetical protein